MKVKEIHIKHPKHGEILVYGSVSKEMNDKIGTVIDYEDHCRYYHAHITVNDNETFTLTLLSAIEARAVNVGYKETDYGCTNNITVYMNIVLDKVITIYPSGVISVIYEDEN